VNPLIEDSRLFAERLAETERQHELVVYPGMPHRFSAYAEGVPVAVEAKRVAAFFERNH